VVTLPHKKELNDLELLLFPFFHQKWKNKGFVYIYGSTTWLGQRNLA
jgi:hypothetical protein